MQPKITQASSQPNQAIRPKEQAGTKLSQGLERVKNICDPTFNSVFSISTEIKSKPIEKKVSDKDISKPKQVNLSRIENFIPQVKEQYYVFLERFLKCALIDNKYLASDKDEEVIANFLKKCDGEDFFMKLNVKDFLSTKPSWSKALNKCTSTSLRNITLKLFVYLFPDSELNKVANKQEAQYFLSKACKFILHIEENKNNEKSNNLPSFKSVYDEFVKARIDFEKSKRLLNEGAEDIKKMNPNAIKRKMNEIVKNSNTLYTVITKPNEPKYSYQIFNLSGLQKASVTIDQKGNYKVFPVPNKSNMNQSSLFPFDSNDAKKSADNHNREFDTEPKTLKIIKDILEENSKQSSKKNLNEKFKITMYSTLDSCESCMLLLMTFTMLNRNQIDSLNFTRLT